MDNSILKQRLLQIFNKDNALSLIDTECQKYICDVIKNKYPTEVDYFRELITQTHIPLRVKESSNNILKLSSNEAIILLSTIIGAIIFHYTFNIPVIGVILGFLSGVYIIKKHFYFFSSIKIIRIKRLENNSRLNDICTIVDSYVKIYCDLCELIRNGYTEKSIITQESTKHALEAKYPRILEWFHSSFERIEGNNWIEHDIKDLLKHYGYEFLDFSNENMSWFERTPGNVEQITTSIPALINTDTKKCIIKGHAIMPR